MILASFFGYDTTHSPFQHTVPHLRMPESPRVTSRRQFEIYFKGLLDVVVSNNDNDSIWKLAPQKCLKGKKHFLNKKKEVCEFLGDKGPKFHKKMLIILHQQQIKLKFIATGGLKPKTFVHFQGSHIKVICKALNSEGHKYVFVFQLGSQNPESASTFPSVSVSLGLLKFQQAVSG